MNHLKNRGIAIISTLLFVGLLFMMALSVIMMSRQRAYTGIAQHQQTQALYLAEAGLAKSMVALESDLDWPGVTDGEIDGIPGSYSVHFGTDKYGSVNNISQFTPTYSYRGDDDPTVPANTALLIVDAQVSGHRYVLETMVRGTGGVGYMTDAILASGKIKAKGDLQVDGITALDDSAKVDGSIQSNKTGSADLVVWDGGGTAHITGNVGTMGADSAAINMPGAVIDGGEELSATANIPEYDIVAEVDANLGHPAPVFDPGGTTTLSGSHTFTPAANETVPGDIVLEDGATLYVKGTLEVIGSISGSGEVYVTEKTIFRGDSSVTTSADHSVSLYSQGNVSLTGFDGTKFLSELADAEIIDYLAVSEVAVQAIQVAANDPGAGPSGDTKETIDGYSAAMGNHLNDPALEWYEQVPGQGTPLSMWILGEDRSNVLGKLQDKVEGLPDGDTQRFLAKRVEKLELLFGSRDDVDPSSYGLAADMFDYFDDTGDTLGFLDLVMSEGATDRWPQAVNLINSMNYDKLGSSYFQGAVYTKGHFYADNEVSILGALIVNGNGSNKENVALPDTTTVELASGDIYLGHRSRVTYVEEMFKDDDSDDPMGPQNLERTVWMGR